MGYSFIFFILLSSSKPPQKETREEVYLYIYYVVYDHCLLGKSPEYTGKLVPVGTKMLYTEL